MYPAKKMTHIRHTVAKSIGGKQPCKSLAVKAGGKVRKVKKPVKKHCFKSGSM